MKILLTLGSVLFLGPIFGLLGTVVGMIQAFNKTTVYGDGSAAELADGISLALGTTEIGLIVGVFGAVALIFGHILTFRDEPLTDEESDRDYVVCMFLGFLGAHHFYAGRTLLGVAYIFTLGGFVVGNYADFIRLAWGHFTDSEGKRIRFKGSQTAH